MKSTIEIFNPYPPCPTLFFFFFLNEFVSNICDINELFLKYKNKKNLTLRENNNNMDLR